MISKILKYLRKLFTKSKPSQENVNDLLTRYVKTDVLMTEAVFHDLQPDTNPNAEPVEEELIGDTQVVKDGQVWGVQEPVQEPVEEPSEVKEPERPCGQRHKVLPIDEAIPQDCSEMLPVDNVIPLEKKQSHGRYPYGLSDDPIPAPAKKPRAPRTTIVDMTGNFKKVAERKNFLTECMKLNIPLDKDGRRYIMHEVSIEPDDAPGSEKYKLVLKVRRKAEENAK